ncbi:DUF6234 family protein [Streptantibioticus parmotrematis]|uniref:DUF6234 family protein n=1 Tax=Streptantibioticus parmotrematis TaxID=2873249 RepID=UPI003401523C
MTPTSSERPSRRRWRLPEPPLTTDDIGVAALLFLFEAFVYVGRMIGYGMTPDPGGSGAEDHAAAVWTAWFLAASLVFAAVAAFFRARFCAVSQVFAVAMLTIFLAASLHTPQQPHPQPAPVIYSPCYSGSGTCH